MSMKIQIKIPPHLKAAGFPTFEEFCANPNKYRRNKEETFAAVDNGSKLIRHLITSTTYEIMGYKCATLEEVERTAQSLGFPIDHLDAKPQAIPELGGKCRMHIVFEPKLLHEIAVT